MSCHIRLSGVRKEYTPSASIHRLTLSQMLFHRDPVDVQTITAVDRMDLTIEDGERVGLIGPNGAGKTTLLQLIASLITPSDGKLDIAGRVHPIMNMGLALRDEVTGRDNIFLDGELHGRSRSDTEALVEKIIAFTELDEFIDLPVRTYSSGMRGRLAFAMATFVEPEILLVDEVLSIGDVSFNRKANDLMRRLADRGRIVVIVSHGMGAIKDMCTRCIWLERGRIVMDGPPEQVTEAYERAMHRADEQDLARKFTERVPLSDKDGRAKIHGVRLERPDGTVIGAIVKSRTDVDLVVRGEISAHLKAPDVSLKIERLDGVLIDNSRLSDSDQPVPIDSPFTLRIAMRPLVLGVGVYRAEVAVLDGEKRVAAKHAVFEVTTDHALIGGTPLVYYPSTLDVRSLDEAVTE